MNSTQRPPLAILVLDHSAKACELRCIPDNPHLFRHGTGRLQRSRKQGLISHAEESLVASHARAFSACQNESGNAEPRPVIHALIIHGTSALNDPNNPELSRSRKSK